MKKKAASAAAAAGGGRLKDGLRPHRNTVFKKKPPMKGHRAGDNISVAPEPSSSSLLIAEDDEPDFPRGGASMLSREEEAEARAEAEEEFERETKWGGKDRKGRNHKKKKSSGVAGHHTDAEDEWASLFGEGISGKLPRFANRITLKNISPGMKLWGVIAEVNSKDLVISLPGGLRGFVRVEEASDIFPDDESKDYVDNFLCSIFHVGQLVSCIVVQVDDDKREAKVNKRIWLSLRLTLLHKGLMLDVVQDGMGFFLQAFCKYWGSSS